MTVRIQIGARLTVCGLPLQVEEEIREANTFPNPEYERRQKYGKFTGQTDRKIRLWHRSADGLVVPRGTFPIIVSVCRKHGAQFEVDDQTVYPPLGFDLEFGGQLYDYQRRALDDLLRYETGLAVMPTGSGKTVLLMAVIHRLDTRALVLVHTRELFNQTRDVIQDWLGVEAGALGAGEWDLQPISVGMIQTLVRRDLDGLADYFGLVAVDEAHHSPARSWSTVLDQLRPHHLYGLTATPFRKDRLTTLMYRTIGSVSAKVKAAEVQDAGRIVAPEIQVVETAFYYELEDESDWTNMISALAEDPDRNDLIASEVRHRLTPDTRALILSDRIAQVHALADLLVDLEPVALTGELAKADRSAGMEAVRNGAQLTIATSGILGEGVDVPGWDVLVQGTPMAGGPRTLQAVGRVTRAAPGKDRATVVDLVDVRVPALVAAFRKRKRLYGGRAA